VGRGILERDGELSGFISVGDFERVVRIVSNADSSDVDRLVAGYDRSGSGRFNYFRLLADLYDGTEPSDGLPHPSRADGIVRTIAEKMGDVYDSSNTCFHRWRGESPSVGPEEFAGGARRDFGVEVSRADAREIVGRFGGRLTLGSFLRLLASGAAPKQQSAEKAQPLDRDDKTLMHIARQAKGKPWAEIIRRGDNPEIIVQRLRRVAIYVLPEDFKPAFTAKGKEALIARIQEFVDAMPS
jgi:hypothetical protein